MLPSGLAGLSENSGYTDIAFAARGRGGRSATAQDVAGTRGHPSQPRTTTTPLNDSDPGLLSPGRFRLTAQPAPVPFEDSLAPRTAPARSHSCRL